MKSTGCMQTDRDLSWSRFCVDLLSKLSLPILAQRHCACSLNVFVPRLSLYPLLRLRNSSSYALGQFGMCSNVQMACPEHTRPHAWLALVGRQATRDAAPPGHRRPVPLGRVKVQGKIKGRGTAWRRKRVCTLGWRGTWILTAPCRWLYQSRIGNEETVCLLRHRAMGLEGVNP
jgi:hypothetical protein